jgi:hypothetical protein
MNTIPLPLNFEFYTPPRASDLAIITSACMRVGAALAGSTRPSSAFNRRFAHQVFWPARGLQGHDAFTHADTRILYVPGRITERLIVHELGHVLDLQEFRTQRPSRLLWQNGVYDETGRLVTGTHTGGIYRRYAGRRSPDNGYRSDDWHDGWQLHPGDPLCTEDWADMWLNWVYRSFVDNPAGRALYHWVNARMRGESVNHP